MLKKSKSLRYLIYAVLTVLFLSIVGRLRIFNGVKGFFEKKVTIPIRQEIFDFKRSIKKDLNGFSLLTQKEKDEYETKIASLINENKELRRLLGSPLPKEWQFLAAKVIWYDQESLTIDQGENSGVKLGMTAITGNTYVGKVNEITPETSIIRLVSFIDEKNIAKVYKKGENLLTGQGLLVGKGLGRISLEQVFLNEKIEKENIVVVPVAKGELLAGEIEEVFEKENEGIKTATVKRLFNPEELSNIFLVKE